MHLRPMHKQVGVGAFEHFLRTDIFDLEKGFEHNALYT